jgi:hypothetical protein
MQKLIKLKFSLSKFIKHCAIFLIRSINFSLKFENKSILRKCCSFDFISIVASQQGTRSRSITMDFWCNWRKSTCRPVWRYLEGRTSFVQTSQQIDTWSSEEDSRARNKFPIDGKCSTFPSGHQEVRSTWRRNFPDCWLVWAQKYSTSDSLSILFR